MLSILKKIARYISGKIITWLTYLMCFAVFFGFYREVVGTNGTFVIFIVFFSYCVCMVLNYAGMRKMLKYEKEGSLTFRKVFRLTFAILCPIYWCWMILSVVPITSYEVWFITGLPISIISFFPLKEVTDYWRDKKIVFWILQIIIYLTILFAEQMTVNSII